MLTPPVLVCAHWKDPHPHFGNHRHLRNGPCRITTATALCPLGFQYYVLSKNCSNLYAFVVFLLVKSSLVLTTFPNSGIPSRFIHPFLFASLLLTDPVSDAHTISPIFHHPHFANVRGLIIYLDCNSSVPPEGAPPSTLGTTALQLYNKQV